MYSENLPMFWAAGLLRETRNFRVPIESQVSPGRVFPGRALKFTHNLFYNFLLRYLSKGDFAKALSILFLS